MKEVDKPLPAGASRRIAVVGAGQAGLQTSLALLARGHTRSRWWPSAMRTTSSAAA